MAILNSNADTVNNDKPTFAAWLALGLLCVVGCLNYLDRVMITTMRGSILEEIPMTEAQFGLLTSLFLWVYGLLSPLTGFLADRFNRSRIIIVSLLVWSIVTWLTAHATTFNELLITRALMGISEACYFPAALALIVDYHRGATRSLATGIHLTGVMVGQSLGFAGGWIAERYEWTTAFTIFGAAGVFHAFILLFFLRDRPKDSIEASSVQAKIKVNFLPAMKDLLTNKDFLLLLGFYSLMGIVGWMTIGWLPTYYKEQFDLSQTQAGMYATLYLHPLAMIGAILGGYLADRFVRKNPRARILVPIFGLCIAAPSVFIASASTVLAVTIVSFMFFSLTRVFSDANLMPIVCQIVDPRYRATAMGTLNACACIIGGIGLYAGGALRDSNVSLELLFRAASLIMLICILLLYLIHPKTKQS